MLSLIFLFLHLVIALLVLIGIRAGLLQVHKYMAIVALFLPFWGVLIVLILHFQIAIRADGKAEIDLEKLKVDSELYRSIAVDDKKVAATTVPIEEALLINSTKERRSIIMDVLNDNPKDYVEFLQKAGNNDDTEVVHYAVTAMVEISKENDYMLQKLETRHAADPEDLTVLTVYCDFLWHCLTQNLMQGQVEAMNRALFAQLTRKKLEMSEPKLQSDYIRLAENDLKRGEYVTAGEIIDGIGEAWPDSEDFILLRLQYLASTGQGEAIRRFIDEIVNKQTYMSSRVKEALAFWAD